MTITNETRMQMIDWILDCSWRDIDCESDLLDLSDDQLVQGINKHYNGGFKQFLQDGGF